MAMPIPPPMQRLATPRVAPRRLIAWTNVTRTRHPLAPDVQGSNKRPLVDTAVTMIHTYGMAKGNRAAIDIHFLWIDSQLFHLLSEECIKEACF